MIRFNCCFSTTISSITFGDFYFIKIFQTTENGGHRYLMTINIGKSGCPLTEEYNKVDCPILAPDSNIRCDVIVDGLTHQLTDHQCDKAFDFKSICIGCPVDGTQARIQLCIMQ